jgi:hypothetical protein
MAGDPSFRADDRVWLTPRTLGAGQVCWRQPAAIVIGHGTLPGYYLVQLVPAKDTPPGPADVHEVHHENLRRSDPHAQRRRQAQRPTRPGKQPTSTFTEIPLFSTAVIEQGGSPTRGGSTS